MSSVLGLLLIGACASHRTTSESVSDEQTPPAAEQRVTTGPARGQAVPAAARRTRATVPTVSMAYPSGDRSTSTVLIERFMPSEATVGIPVEYETLVTNLTSIPLDSVVVMESADANFTIVESEPRIASSTTSGNQWNLGTIPPHESMSIWVRGMPKSTKPVQTCTSVSYTAAVCASFGVVQPGLQLVAVGTKEAVVCDELTYTYEVTNTGTGHARNVLLDIRLPEGLSDSQGKRSFQHRIDALASGESEEFTIEAKGSRTGSFECTAVATADGDLKATANEIQTILRQPRLRIEADGPARVFLGRDLRTELTVTNDGDVVARELAVPPSIKFKAASADGEHRAGKLEWTITDLEPDESHKLLATFEGSTIGRVRATATAQTYCAEQAQVVLDSAVEGVPAVLLEVIDLADPIVVGSTNTYLITVTNQGSAPATDVSISVLIPEQASYVSSSGQTPTAALAGAQEVTFAPVASIDPGREVVWRVNVRGVKPGDARFRVKMTSTQLESPVEESESTNFYD